MYFRINRFKTVGVFVFLFLLSVASVFGQENMRGFPTPVVTANLLSTRTGDKEIKFHSLDLVVNNPEKFPIWVLIPAFAEDNLPKDGILRAKKPWTKSCISGLTYVDTETGRNEGSVKRLVKVHFIGEKQGFYAFHLPPFAKMDFNGYVINSLKPVSSFEIVMASDLLINGKLPIDQYLIYESLASKQVTIRRQDIRFLNVDWDEENLVTEENRTAIEFIKIEKTNTIVVPIRGI